MRICSWGGSVTFAIPLVTAIFLLLLFEFVQHDIQLVESVRPQALVLLDPIMNGFERIAVEPIHPLPSFLSHLNRSHFSEHPKVLGHLWLTHPEQAHHFVHGTLPAGE